MTYTKHLLKLIVGTALIVGQSAFAQLWLGESITVPKAGGVVKTSNNRVTITAPASAVPVDTSVSVIPNPSAPMSLTSVLDTAFALGGPGVTFGAGGVTLSIQYNQSNVPAGLAESSLHMYRVVNHRWNLVPGSVDDPVANVVHAKITGTGTFGILASSAPTLVENMLVLRYDDFGDPHFYRFDQGGGNVQMLGNLPASYPNSGVNPLENAVYWGQGNPNGGELYTSNIDGSNPRRMTALGIQNGNGIRFAPAGDKIFGSVLVGGVWKILRMGADGSAPAFIANGGSTSAPDVNAQGTEIAFADNNKITIMSFTGTVIRTLIPGGTAINEVAFNPAGTVLAFSMLKGTSPFAIYTIPVAGGVATQRSTANNNGSPRWSPDGNQIVYNSLGLGGLFRIPSTNLAAPGTFIARTNGHVTYIWR